MLFSLSLCFFLVLVLVFNVVGALWRAVADRISFVNLSARDIKGGELLCGTLVAETIARPLYPLGACNGH